MFPLEFQQGNQGSSGVAAETQGSSLVVDSGLSRLVSEGSSRVAAGYSGLLLSCGWASSHVCHVGGSMVRGLLYF